MKKILKALRPLTVPVGLAYSAIEYSLLVIRARHYLREAEFVHPLMFWSFGHVAIDPHMLAMRFAGQRLVILVSRYPGDFTNKYILDAFDGAVKIAYLGHSRLSGLIWQMNVIPAWRVKKINCGILRLLIWLFGGGAEVVEDYHEFRGPTVSGIWMVEYIDRLNSAETVQIRAPEIHMETFQRNLRRDRPDLAGKWFVSLYLRRKFGGRLDVRDTNQWPYRVVVRRVAELGGFTFLGGDADEHDFRDLSYWVTYSNFSAERGLVDLYFLTQCRFLVGGHSGPTTIAASFNVPTLITNNAFFYLAGYRENQIFVNKGAQWKSTGEMLKPEELFSMPVVGFSDSSDFERAGIRLIDNTAGEISAALEEMVAQFITGDFSASEYDDLFQWFRDLLPTESVAYRSPSRPAVSYLRSLADAAVSLKDHSLNKSP